MSDLRLSIMHAMENPIVAFGVLMVIASVCILSLFLIDKLMNGE